MKTINKLLSLLIVTSLMMSCSGQKEKPEQKEARVAVTVGEAQLTKVPKLSKYAGTVVSDDHTVLSTKVQGQINQIHVDEGQRIAKGDLLVTIKSTELRAQLAEVEAGKKEAEAAAENYTQTWNRIRNLFEKGSATRQELDNATAAKDMATAKVEAMRQKLIGVRELLSYATLRSPIDGFVSVKYMNTGDMASPGQPLLALESTSRLKMEVMVPEFEIGQFDPEEKIEIQLNALPNKIFDGTIDQIVPSSAYSGAQFKVTVKLDQHAVSIKPGMYGHVIRRGQSEEKLLVPSNALKRTGQLTGIFTLSDQDVAVLRWIMLGKERKDGFEVLSGLEPGERYVTASNSRLSEGMKLEIKKSL